MARMSYVKILESAPTGYSLSFAEMLKFNTFRPVVPLYKNRYMYYSFFESFLGLRQGCNLSPMLYDTFINDPTEIFDENCCPVMTGNYNLNCLLYANNLLLLSETVNGLKECIAQLGHHAKVWKLLAI